MAYNIKVDIKERGEGAERIILFFWVGGGSCEHAIEPMGSIKCGKLRDYLGNMQLLKKGNE